MVSVSGGKFDDVQLDIRYCSRGCPKGKYARFSRPQGFKPSGSCRRLLRMAKYTSPKWRLAVFSLDAVRPGGRLLGSRRFRIDNDRSELCFAGLPQPVGASGDQGDGLEHDREVWRP